MPDPHEPRRQHVQEEPAEELDRLQRHRLLLPAVGVVLPAERRPGPSSRPISRLVADRHPVGVPGQVLEHLLRAAERRLGVDDPLGAGSWRRATPELGRVGQRGELAVEREPAPVEGGLEQGQELAPEDAAEDPDRQEEPRPAGDPA